MPWIVFLAMVSTMAALHDYLHLKPGKTAKQMPTSRFARNVIASDEAFHLVQEGIYCSAAHGI